MCFFPFSKKEVLASFVRCLRKQVQMITGESDSKDLVWKQLFAECSERQAETGVGGLMVSPLLNGERHVQAKRRLCST